MLFEIRSGVYIKTIWWSFRKGTDVLGVILKDEEGWSFRYRFRYYDEESTDPFDGKDKKSFYSTKFPEEKLEEACKFATLILEKMTKSFGAEQTYKWDIEKWGDDPSILEVLKALPFIHTQR